MAKHLSVVISLLLLGYCQYCHTRSGAVSDTRTKHNAAKTDSVGHESVLNHEQNALLSKLDKEKQTSHLQDDDDEDDNGDDGEDVGGEDYDDDDNPDATKEDKDYDTDDDDPDANKEDEGYDDDNQRETGETQLQELGDGDDDARSQLSKIFPKYRIRRYRTKRFRIVRCRNPRIRYVRCRYPKKYRLGKRWRRKILNRRWRKGKWRRWRRKFRRTKRRRLRRIRC